MKILRPLKAIRSKCLDCSGGQLKEIRLCQIVSCSLWPYRMGKRPVKNHGDRYNLNMSDLDNSMERT